MKKSEYILEPAEIVWDGKNPYSPKYGDVYGQEDHLIQEKLNVFVKPFIHEGFASYFYGFVQEDSKRALDSPQKSDFCQKWAFLSRR